MAVYETIGPVGTGSNYTDIQSWINAHAYDYANAPYIATIRAGTYTVASSTYIGANFNNLGFTPDSTHYYRLQAHPNESFRGIFDGNYPLLSIAGAADGSARIGIYASSYTQISGIVCSINTTAGTGVQDYAIGFCAGDAFQGAKPATGVLFENCGAYNINAVNGWAIGFGTGPSSDYYGQPISSCTMRNCVAANITSTVYNSGNEARAAGFCADSLGASDYFYVYQCVAHNIVANNSYGDAAANAAGVFMVSSACKVRNSAFGVVSASRAGSTGVASPIISSYVDFFGTTWQPSSVDVDWNAATTSINRGTHNVYPVTPENMWANVGSGIWNFQLPMVSSPALQWRGRTLTGFPNYPATDISGKKWTTGPGNLPDKEWGQ